MMSSILKNISTDSAISFKWLPQQETMFSLISRRAPMFAGSGRLTYSHESQERQSTCTRQTSGVGHFWESAITNDKFHPQWLWWQHLYSLGFIFTRKYQRRRITTTEALQKRRLSHTMLTYCDIALQQRTALVLSSRWMLSHAESSLEADHACAILMGKFPRTFDAIKTDSKCNLLATSNLDFSSKQLEKKVESFVDVNLSYGSPCFSPLWSFTKFHPTKPSFSFSASVFLSWKKNLSFSVNSSPVRE